MLFEKQQYQTGCVENIVQVLNNCDVLNNDFGKLPRAIDALWKDKGYHQFQKFAKNRLDVLMETGTGKTFTYLKTIFELHKQFGKNKFIIVLPRTAIKLGVIQNIKLTKAYFFGEYKQYLNYIDYRGKTDLGCVQNNFINSTNLSVLITTNSAFNSDKNNINKTTETLFEHGSTWKGIASQNPIVIIDEPHLLKGTQTQKGLDKLENSLQIRFGATFPKDKKDEEHHLSNVVYSLDSISAFNEYLVKGITVHTVIGDSEQGNLKVIKIESSKKKFTVVYDRNQAIYRREIGLREDIGAKTELEKYRGVVATKITKDKIALSDDQEHLEVSKGSYELGDEEIRSMIKTTVEKHFEKEEKLFSKGIKVLSLFFIPRVDDFRKNDNNPNPRIKRIFETEYQLQRETILKKDTNEEYKKYLSKDFSEDGKLKVHEGYFSGDKGTADAKEENGVHIILNQKEKLLSFDTPLRFIFSVWALQEGWDNPNIFQICKLSDTHKETSRRQQVGRGLRIAVNQEGKRLTHKYLEEKDEDFYAINTLDMIVSGKEKEFIQQIQQEVQEASFSLVGDIITNDILRNRGLNQQEINKFIHLLEDNNIIKFDKTKNEYQIISSVNEFIKQHKNNFDFLSPERYEQILKIFTENRPPITDGNKSRKKVKIREKQWGSFKELWETINKKSKIVYKGIQEEEEKKIIKQIAEQFKKEDITPIKIKVRTEVYNTQKDKIETKEEKNIGVSNFFQTQKFIDFINYFVKDEKLPFAFMLKLLSKIEKQQIKNNPDKAKKRLIEILKNTLHHSILKQVSYEFNETSIYPNSLQDNENHFKKEINHTLLGRFYEEESPDHLLYDTICYDSAIEENIQKNDPKEVNGKQITVFAKLPKISIPTPYKTYNPDFAYLIDKGENEKKLFLVVEAKGYDNEGNIPQEEKQKIEYARTFFDSLQKQLPNMDIQYKTRINKKGLSDLLSQIK